MTRVGALGHHVISGSRPLFVRAMTRRGGCDAMKEAPGSGRRNLGDELGLTRRDLLRRGAVVGGTLLWVAPAIQSIAPKAYAVQQVGSFRACCQCAGTQKQPAGCTVDVISYDQCFQLCGGPPNTAYYGVGNYACQDGNCVPLDEEVQGTTGVVGPSGATGPSGASGAIGPTGATGTSG
jgi:hypothetical protein